MDHERDLLMKRVGRAMLLPAEHSGLTVARPDGTRPVVPALASDRVPDILHAVREAGGCANVVMADGPTLISFAIREDGEAHGPDDVPVHSDTTMGMFLTLVREVGQVRTFIVAPDSVITTEQPHPVLAPA